mmetsp:Transcript_27638/g.110702  ORF Transcript_27638/g.110702 Transcript_27638/m.110702 type:complete len:214 (-) Transcript_27638:683-1324(-)
MRAASRASTCCTAPRCALLKSRGRCSSVPRGDPPPRDKNRLLLRGGLSIIKGECRRLLGSPTIPTTTTTTVARPCARPCSRRSKKEVLESPRSLTAVLKIVLHKTTKTPHSGPHVTHAHHIIAPRSGSGADPRRGVSVARAAAAPDPNDDADPGAAAGRPAPTALLRRRRNTPRSWAPRDRRRAASRARAPSPAARRPSRAPRARRCPLAGAT